MIHIRLLPNGLTLSASAGDTTRFTRLFREVWRAVPEADQHRLTRYWQSSPVPPDVELVNDWSGRRPRMMATIASDGRQLRFCASAMDRASEEEVHYCIAHELAHVQQWATGEHLEPLGARERDAHARALEWLGLRRRPQRTPALREWLHAETRRELAEERERADTGEI